VKGNFTFPAAGFQHELSPRARRQLAEAFPNLPTDSIEDAITLYVMLRDAQQPEPGEGRKTLRAVRKWAHKGRQLLHSPEFAHVESFVRQHIAQSNAPIDVEELRHTTLTALADVCAGVEASIRTGGGINPHQRLVGALAQILRDAGQAIDKRPTGALCRLIGLVLEELEESMDVPKLMAPIVHAMENAR
jgi:hypothetical protein